MSANLTSLSPTGEGEFLPIILTKGFTVTTGKTFEVDIDITKPVPARAVPFDITPPPSDWIARRALRDTVLFYSATACAIAVSLFALTATVMLLVGAL